MRTRLHPVPTTPATAGVTPNWFAAVMGTGIVAVAAVGLPVQLPGQRTAAQIVWLLAATLLIALCVASAKQWRRARAHAADPIMLQFYGAPPMALMTVGGGALLLGPEWLPAVPIATVLWLLGTAGGLFTAVAVPYRMITRQYREPAFGGWLMPVVPPMVSAANGALLAPLVPFGDDLRLVCGAMFGASLIAAGGVIVQLWGRLFTQPPMPARLIPTLWIVLGPLGQSMTAAHLLVDDALFYTLPVWGFAMLWLALAAALTIRAKPPFGLPWWSFTFPLGTVVTGTTGLATSTGSPMLMAAAVGLFGLLVALWAIVAARTVRSVISFSTDLGVASSVLAGGHPAHRSHHDAVAVDDLASERHQ